MKVLGIVFLIIFGTINVAGFLIGIMESNHYSFKENCLNNIRRIEYVSPGHYLGCKFGLNVESFWLFQEVK